MLPTPSTSHVSFEKVYEPAEDSYLLLDTLSSPSEVAFLSSRFRPCLKPAKDAGAESSSPLIVEVGTGSGIILAFLTAHAGAIFGREDVLTLGTDVNSYACHVCQNTVTRAVDESISDSAVREGSHTIELTPMPAKYLDSLVADLCGPLRPGLVDILVFNPPYVPTPGLPSVPEPGDQVAFGSVDVSANSYDYNSQLLALSYAGGVDGMETTDRLFAELDEVLDNRRGVAYVLLCAQNKPRIMKDRLRQSGLGWDVETVSRSGKKAGWEKLEIVRISRRRKGG
ncbi:S-adenosylmethionine-dependent methyltransferase [Acarospora aff. strigata]|nr:S-adenosylmethionine-dependent methyltransferase [Acarospora aff. strigata]